MKINVNNAAFITSIGSPRQFLKGPKPQIAFSGRSNVGKSSLINMLLGRKSIAKVSSSPGKTVTVNLFDIDGKLYFVDLPGYGFAKRSQEKKAAFSSLTESYFTDNPSADALKLVLQLVDIRTGPTEDDLLMIQFLYDRNVPFLVVYTKADKLSPAAIQAQTELIKNTCFSEVDIKTVVTSSEKRQGKDEVWAEIFSALQSPSPRSLQA
ncbi:MAG: ribosome biogenesis GTP-binding protein YihA/YsxC [Clostridia bacterium]|nr:ribosome biogenesis GTP-binding protein YihA/YsxC [Clostridia bacterium]